MLVGTVLYLSLGVLDISVGYITSSETFVDVMPNRLYCVNLYSHRSVWEFLLFCIFSRFRILSPFNFSHSGVFLVVSHVVLICISRLLITDTNNLFLCLLVISFMACPCPFLNGAAFFFMDFWEFFTASGYEFCVSYMCCKYLLFLCDLPFYS